MINKSQKQVMGEIDRTRNQGLDGLKFFLIFLVVLGHLPLNDGGLKLGNMIYSFHMPAFVMLSGYFTSFKKTQSDQLKWIKHTLLIYLFAQVTQIAFSQCINIAKYFLQGYELEISIVSVLNNLLQPGFALWYLASLIWWRIIIWKIGGRINHFILLIFSFVLAIMIGFIPVDDYLSVQRTITYFPFFVLGVIIKNNRMEENIQKTPLVISICVMVACLFVSRYLPYYCPKSQYINTHDAVLRVCQTLIGGVFVWLSSEYVIQAKRLNTCRGLGNTLYGFI